MAYMVKWTLAGEPDRSIVSPLVLSICFPRLETCTKLSEVRLDLSSAEEKGHMTVVCLIITPPCLFLCLLSYSTTLHQLNNTTSICTTIMDHELERCWKKNKGKCSLCLTKYHAMKTYLASGGIVPHIRNLDTRSRWVIRSTPRPLYPPVTILIEGWVDPRAGLEAVGKRTKSHHCPWREWNPGRPARILFSTLTELTRLINFMLIYSLRYELRYFNGGRPQ